MCFAHIPHWSTLKVFLDYIRNLPNPSVWVQECDDGYMEPIDSDEELEVAAEWSRGPWSWNWIQGVVLAFEWRSLVKIVSYSKPWQSNLLHSWAICRSSLVLANLYCEDNLPEKKPTFRFGFSSEQMHQISSHANINFSDEPMRPFVAWAWSFRQQSSQGNSLGREKGMSYKDMKLEMIEMWWNPPASVLHNFTMPPVDDTLLSFPCQRLHVDLNSRTHQGLSWIVSPEWQGLQLPRLSDQ